MPIDATPKASLCISVFFEPIYISSNSNLFNLSQIHFKVAKVINIVIPAKKYSRFNFPKCLFYLA